MIDIKKPYLIIPKLIHQPTWGGKYIVTSKRLELLSFLSSYSIGQSYELFSGTKLLTSIVDTNDKRFCPEVGFADTSELDDRYFDLKKDKDYINLSELVKEDDKSVLGRKTVDTFHDMPLLIKVTQALGNSYQLHIKPEANDGRWKPKPESWYYLSSGMLTCGIRNGVSLMEYEKLCREIDRKMHEISQMIVSKSLDVTAGRKLAYEFIQKNNPVNFVNLVEAKENDIFDMSVGGRHHSWEENKVRFPQGNIIYEVQQDQMDPVSTIRSFDQGKLKDDGSMREINIDDYFKYLDSTEETNDIENIKKEMNGINAFRTQYYSMDVIKVEDKLKMEQCESFVHLYVRGGDVTVETDYGKVRVLEGFSCFVPQSVSALSLQANKPNSVVLKTYID